MGTADGAFNVLVRVGGEAEPPFSLAGAFNVLLNSLAVSFCLDVDDQLSTSTSVLPRSLLRRFDVSGNGKRPLVDDEALWAPIARALLTHAHPDRVRRQLDLTPMLVVGASPFCSSSSVVPLSRPRDVGEDEKLSSPPPSRPPLPSPPRLVVRHLARLGVGDAEQDVVGREVRVVRRRQQDRDRLAVLGVGLREPLHGRAQVRRRVVLPARRPSTCRGDES